MPEQIDVSATAVRDAIAGLFGVVVDAARLWWQHLPVLLTVALLGGAGRMGAIWGATAVSETSNTLGVAVLVLAPLSSVTAIVLMLHVLRSAMPRLAAISRRAAPADLTTHHERRVLDVLASVLVPFLAVYASYGLLAEDTLRYRNAILGEEFLANADIFYGTDEIDVDRFVFATGWMAVAIVVAAIVLRWGLARIERRATRGRGTQSSAGRRPLALAFTGAYVEVFWMTTLAAHVILYRDQVWAWIEGRRAAGILADWWLSVLDAVGPVARPLDAIVDWVVQILSSVDALVVVPLSWLAVGAVVYGHQLAPAPRLVRTPAMIEQLPGPVRRWSRELVGPVVGDLRSRFTGLVGGIRQLARAGLGPMLVFGLAFLASARLEEGLGLLARHLLGPRPVDTWLAFAPHVATITRAIGLTVTMALLAAAVDRVLAAQLDSAQPVTVQPVTVQPVTVQPVTDAAQSAASDA